MKIFSQWQCAIFSMAILSISACSSSGSNSASQGVPNEKTIAVDQTQWKKLTDAGDAALKSGDKTKAESNYQAAVVAAQALGIDTIPEAQALSNLANFYYVQGNGAQADGLYKKSLHIHEKALGLEHVDLFKDLIGMARVCNSEKRYEEACGYYYRGIAIMNKAKQPVPADVAAEYKQCLSDNAKVTPPGK